MFEKILNRLLGIICILLAFAVTFGIAPVINKTASAKTDILRLTRNIPQGTQISDSDLQSVSVGAFNLPDNIITDKDDVIGKFAACDLKSDDYLLPSKICDTADSASDVFKSLNGSQRAISITINSFAGGLSGKLLNGDIVSVIVVNRDSGTVILSELKYIRVITTTSSSGYDADSNNDDKNEMPSTVTLLVNEEQARLLAEHENNSSIHLSLVYRGNEETANQFLEVQKAVFDNKSKKVEESDE